MTENKSIDSPTMQLALMRMMLQQQATPTFTAQPVTGINQGISYGLMNGLNAFMLEREHHSALKQLETMQQTQRDAEAETAKNHAADVTNFLISNGVDPQTAIQAGSAGVADSTINNLLSASQDTQKAEKVLQDKGNIYNSVLDGYLNLPGFNRNNPASLAQAHLAAMKAAYGADGYGGTQFGEQIGGNLKLNTLNDLSGGNPNKYNTNEMSPAEQMAFHGYGITPFDKVSETHRLADASNAATGAMYAPATAQANINHTNAGTIGQGITNDTNNINLGLLQDQTGLGHQYLQGNVSAPEFLRGSAGLSLNPIAAMNTIAANKNLFGSGHMFPNADAFSFPAPQPVAPVLPQQPAAPPMSLDRAGGHALRQHALNFGNAVYQLPGQAYNAGAGLLHSINDFGHGLFGQ